MLHTYRSFRLKIPGAPNITNHIIAQNVVDQ